MEQMELGLDQLKQLALEEESNLLQIVVYVLAKRLGLQEIDFTKEEMEMPIDNFAGLEVIRYENSMKIAIRKGEVPVIQ